MIIERLSQEHRNIEKLLAILARELEVFDRGDRPDYEVIRAVNRIPIWAPPSIQGLFYMYRRLAECPCFGEFDGVVTMRAFEELRQDGRAGSAELTRYRN